MEGSRSLVAGSLDVALAHGSAPLDSSDSASADVQWKALALKCNPLHDILIVQQGPGCVFWDVEIFHNYLRNVRAAKWLRKQDGASRVHKLSQMLYPHLDYKWIPSTAMFTAGDKKCILPGMARAMKSGTTVMANRPWLLMYLLSTNSMRVIRASERWVRDKAFRILSSLVQLACESSCPTMEDAVRINTYFGNAVVDRTGMVRGSDEWKAHISKHNSRCIQILTSLGSSGYRKRAGLSDFGSECGVAAMMWHWALLTNNTKKSRAK